MSFKVCCLHIHVPDSRNRFSHDMAKSIIRLLNSCFEAWNYYNIIIYTRMFFSFVLLLINVWCTYHSIQLIVTCFAKLDQPFKALTENFKINRQNLATSDHDQVLFSVFLRHSYIKSLKTLQETSFKVQHVFFQ